MFDFDYQNPTRILFGRGKIAEIGINCRLCERPDCPQRAVPPLDRAVIVDPWERGILPYRLG